MLPGPDSAGNLHEIGVVESHGGPLIVHDEGTTQILEVTDATNR